MDNNSVCFMCARCKQLVKLDSSFDSIDDQTIQDLIASSKVTGASSSTNGDKVGDQQFINNVEVSLVQCFLNVCSRLKLLGLIFFTN